jgi:Protein of unknown function (DUF1444)
MNEWARAIAYLKAKLPDEDPGVAVSLSPEDSPVLRDLGNGLLVSYVVDEGKNFGYVQKRHLFAAGIGASELHKSAIDNLYTLAEKHLRIQPYGPVFAVFMEGNFEASVLLLDTVWEVSLAKHVREEFVAAVPARDVLAFGDSSSPEAITELRTMIGRLKTSKGDHLLSTSLYRRKNGAWVPYDI